jgi:hypothetical protein
MSNMVQSSEVRVQEFEEGSWDGVHEFANVYACQFPFPEIATCMIQVMFNGNAIHMTKVDYPDDYCIYIVSSTRPFGKSEEEEFEEQKNRVMDLVNSLGELIKAGAQKVPLGFGEGVFYDLKNVAIDNDAALFPFELSFYNKPSLVTMSSHVCFSLGDSRVEVVGLRVASSEGQENWEQDTHERLQKFRQQLLATMGAMTNQIQSGLTQKNKRLKESSVNLKITPALTNNKKELYFVDEKHNLHCSSDEVMAGRNLQLTQISPELALVLGSRDMNRTQTIINLLNHYPDVYLYSTIEDNSGAKYTALALAVMSQNLALIKFLISKGFDVSRLGNSDMTLIDFAWQYPSTAEIRSYIGHHLGKYAREELFTSEPSLDKTPSTYIASALEAVLKSMAKTEVDEILKADLLMAIPYFKSAIKVAKVYSLTNNGKRNYKDSGKSPMSFQYMFNIATSCNQTNGALSSINEILNKIKSENGAEFKFMANYLNEKLDMDINFLRTNGSDEITEKVYKISLILNNKTFFDLVYEKANSFK